MQVQKPHRYKATADQAIAAINEIWPTLTTAAGNTSPFDHAEMNDNQIILYTGWDFQYLKPVTQTFDVIERDGITTIIHSEESGAEAKPGSPIVRGVQQIFEKLSVRFPVIP